MSDTPEFDRSFEESVPLCIAILRMENPGSEPTVEQVAQFFKSRFPEVFQKNFEALVDLGIKTRSRERFEL